MSQDIDEKPEFKKGRYKHFKGGIYEVLDVACHSETQEWYVMYESQTRKVEGLPSLWIRPYKMFFENVTREGKTFPRFTYIGETKL